MRLIDADELLTHLNACLTNGRPLSNLYDLSEIVSYVESMPTVDAVPVVHGEWQWISSTYDRTPCEMKFRCSICHHEVIRHNAEPWEHYCPQCGAKMDGKEQENDKRRTDVVRCKDCKWFKEFTDNGNPTGRGSCENDKLDMFHSPRVDWFCADGEVATVKDDDNKTSGDVKDG